MHRLLITPGEPAGVGPDVLIQAIQESLPGPLIAIADPDLLTQRAQMLHLPLHLHEWQEDKGDKILPPGHLYILACKQNLKTEVGVLNPGNADYVHRSLQLAAQLCLEKKASAVITGPVHKGTMNRGGIAFVGHTEFFARSAAAIHTVMLFVADKMKVALATTHIPLAQVPTALTKESLLLTLTTLHHGLQSRFQIPNPTIYVCGLNPHAGESGYMGREEIDVITPVISELSKQNYNIIGPLPADTIFTPTHMKQADVILAMYHDQGLPVVKFLGFGQAVNVTLGLPFIRTSVDHGTALDLAGTGKADAGSLKKAIVLASRLG